MFQSPEGGAPISRGSLSICLLLHKISTPGQDTTGNWRTLSAAKTACSIQRSLRRPQLCIFYVLHIHVFLHMSHVHMYMHMYMHMCMSRPRACSLHIHRMPHAALHAHSPFPEQQAFLCLDCRVSEGIAGRIHLRATSFGRPPERLTLPSLALLRELHDRVAAIIVVGGILFG